jgi:hypothetical protein
VRELLHTNNRGLVVGATQAQQLCDKFHSVFMDKLRRIGSDIQQRLRNYTAQRRVVCRECATSLDTLAPVTAKEVTRIIRRLPYKPAHSDCLSMSLLKAAVDVMAPLLAECATGLLRRACFRRTTKPVE